MYGRLELAIYKCICMALLVDAHFCAWEFDSSASGEDGDCAKPASAATAEGNHL